MAFTPRAWANGDTFDFAAVIDLEQRVYDGVFDTLTDDGLSLGTDATLTSPSIGVITTPANMFINGGIATPIIEITGDTSTISANGSGQIEINGALRVSGPVGFNGVTTPAKPTVTGSRAGNAALASVLTALASMGLITNSSSA